MHFNQETLTQIGEKARALEIARKALDAAQKLGAEWPTIERLQAAFDVAQDAMANAGIQATATLPRSIKAEA